MNNRLMMVIAVVAGLIATVLAFLYIQSATSAVEESGREETIKVLFLTADLPANHPIDPEKDLLERTIGVESNAGIVRNAVLASLKDSVRGQRLNKAMFAASPLLYSDLQEIQKLTIGPGNRALSIPVDSASTFGGMLIPGDRVDLVVSYKLPAPESTAPLPNIDPNNPGAGISALVGRAMMQSSLPSEWDAEVVLENILVIAIGDQLSASRQQFSFAPDQFAAGNSNIVTLELSTDQALALIRSRAGGGNALTLLLRPSRGMAGSTSGLTKTPPADPVGDDGE